MYVNISQAFFQYIFNSLIFYKYIDKKFKCDIY